MDLSTFIKKHNLPETYGHIANQWFVPMIQRIIATKQALQPPIVIGINGSQGSGKSTLADLMVDTFQQRNIHALSLSIDDFYLTRTERQTLAHHIHPLLATRGVPGTHDIKLALKTLSSLLQGHTPVAIPRFDKSQDDRYSSDKWETVTTPVDIIILEGWCVGSEAQPKQQLLTPINTLETNKDSVGDWRNYANMQLQQYYPALFSQIDVWIMLKAPSFECVFNWRLEQEDKLRQACDQQQTIATGIMNHDEIAHFIQHYQRITEHTLKTLPDKVHFLFELDSHRNITHLSYPIAL